MHIMGMIVKNSLVFSNHDKANENVPPASLGGLKINTHPTIVCNTEKAIHRLFFSFFFLYLSLESHISNSFTGEIQRIKQFSFLK